MTARIDASSSEFSQRGLPAKSGLSLDQNSGVIAGIPNTADLQASQPILIEVLAIDGFGKVEERILPLMVIDVTMPVKAAPSMTRSRRFVRTAHPEVGGVYSLWEKAHIFRYT